MLHVLQLIPTLDRSGAEKQLALLAQGLPRDRFRVEVAALTRLGPLEAELRESDVPVTLIGKRGKLDPMAFSRLTRFLREKQFDIVQTWLFAANVYGRLASRRAKVPVVLTTEMAVDLWKSRAHLALDRWLARDTDRIIGNSQAVVDFYQEAGIPAEKLVMIHSGIAEEEPTTIDPREVRRELGIAEDAPLLLFAGRLAEQKRVDDLIQALDLLQHVEPSLVTLIAGDGPLRSRLEDLAQAFDLLNPGRVRFLGHRDDVPRLLAASDLLVLPSLYEGLPNIVLEAMRFRKAVVATSAPGTTEVVSDGKTGLLVPTRSPKELARALRTLVRDPELRSQLGEAGRARVETDFRVSAMIEQFATLYEQLASEKGCSVATL